MLSHELYVDIPWNIHVNLFNFVVREMRINFQFRPGVAVIEIRAYDVSWREILWILTTI